MTDLSRLSYRMSKQLDMALNDLNHVRENIDEINKIEEDFEREHNDSI